MIGGRTTVVGIVADPIAHVRTPQLFNTLMQERQRDAVMVPLHVPAPALAEFMAGARAIRSLAGLVVTLPHKESVLAHCTRQTESARRARAANVIRFDHAAGETIGANTDGEGLLAGLRQQGVEVRGRRIYLAGAGGAAKAIAAALAGAGVSAIGIHNRTAARAAALVEQLRAEYPALETYVAADTPANYAMAINATSLGLDAADPLPFRLERLAREALVVEIVMQAEVTPLLAAARERGHRIHPGRHMLEGQVERIAEFLGVLGQ